MRCCAVGLAAFGWGLCLAACRGGGRGPLCRPNALGGGQIRATVNLQNRLFQCAIAIWNGLCGAVPRLLLGPIRHTGHLGTRTRQYRRPSARDSPLFEPGLTRWCRQRQGQTLAFNHRPATARRGKRMRFSSRSPPLRGAANVHADLSYVHAAAREIAAAPQGFSRCGHQIDPSCRPLRNEVERMTLRSIRRPTRGRFQSGRSLPRRCYPHFKFPARIVSAPRMSRAEGDGRYYRPLSLNTRRR